VSFHDAPPVLKEMADLFVGAAREAGRKAVRGDIRVPRFIHVADSTKRARNEVRDAITPMLERRKRTFPWQFERWLPPSGKMEDVTFDYLVDAGAIFVGDPEAVYEGIKTSYDEIGGFGVLLLLAGKDIGTRAQRQRSWRLFMQHIAPRLADLDPDRTRPLPSLP
jgi:alkanesulfonate monooxygenase SsuD/methylene tetrahydromethanopterin reductase-like flavin-dependent oxidoreductase (luciferase family)